MTWPKTQRRGRGEQGTEVWRAEASASGLDPQGHRHRAVRKEPRTMAEGQAQQLPAVVP